MRYALPFPTGSVEYLFDEDNEELALLAPPADTILITDDHVAQVLPDFLKDYKRIELPAGEASKSWDMAATIAAQLMEHKAHRQTMLLGVGGGVVTDITGFIASVYMRGVSFGFVPSSLLGMVDASVGGKNGVNHQQQKNMLGTFRQPQFIWYDTEMLQTLPDEEWSNGFAEIIKYGFIADSRILGTLAENDVEWFQKHPQQLAELVAGCVDVKNKIVHADEQETGIRKHLNFGHTCGHAFEALYNLPHGYGVGLGMIVASLLSQKHASLDAGETKRLIALLKRYKLPVSLKFDVEKVLQHIQLDKKRSADTIDFVLIEKPGVATLKKLSFEDIAAGLAAFADGYKH